MSGFSVDPVSVAILAGGKGNRFRQSKALTQVAGKPLVLHVVDASESYADEIMIVVHSAEDREELIQYVPEAQIVIDQLSEPRCPLVGALTAFQHARNPYTQLLPCDSPVIDPMFFEIMWGMVENHNAAVPRWPNGWIEPLHSIFRTAVAKEVADQCLNKDLPRMRCLIDNIGRVIYLSTLALKRFDSKLHTFLNVNTPADLRRVESLLGRRQTKGA